MHQLSKQEVAELLRFVEHQTAFVVRTTAQVTTHHDFLNSEAGMVLFNSTCMCLQSIGKTIRQVDDRTAGRLLALYPETPWKHVIALYDIITHEYLNIDVELIFDIVHEEMHPLLETTRRLLSDIDARRADQEMDKLWQSGQWNEQTLTQLKQAHQRTPYETGRTSNETPNENPTV